MTIYSGQAVNANNVTIGAPDFDALHHVTIAADVAGSVRQWTTVAVARDDVLYFGIFWNNRAVGQILLHDMERHTSLVAYHLFDPADRGRGIGTQALGLLQELVRTATMPSQLIIITSRENLASQRVAQKCGFVDAGAPWEDPLNGIRLIWNVPCTT